MVMGNQAKLLTAYSRQYADHMVRDITFQVGEQELFNVSPIQGVMRFSKRDKLSPHYIGPFEILDRVGANGLQVSTTSQLDWSSFDVSYVYAKDIP
ncbi:hypothetical protein MTR67_016278 [Solanum verrucosum]|uniref:Tf2-1-like SH3-like domain-containing protein n=1 Tax=Solanum verrucosum TaxID=315347 RepID=A0AAF0QI47_SOLVR|nr:hypothetical protein MTR67_016278 [Solanum verrucosum]